MPEESLIATGQAAAPTEPARWFDTYTGNRLPQETRLKIMDMLSNPRQQFPYARIISELKVSEGVVKAIEANEAETIAERKAKLMTRFFRIADKAALRVEETIDTAACSAAAVVAGISTEKALLLAGEPTQRIEINLNPVDIYSDLRTLHAEMIQSLQLPAATDVDFVKLPDTPSAPSSASV